MFILHLAATILSITGAVLLAVKKPIKSQLVWAVGNTLWITYWVIQKDVLSGLTFITFLALSVWGVYNWKKVKRC